MGFSFFENMRGDLTDNNGDNHFIDFDIKAEAPQFGRFLKEGCTQISGIVHILPWAENAPLTGTLHISPFFQRTLEYEFNFNGDDGHLYHFKGRKDLDWKHPLETMTVMQGKLLKENECLAKGSVHFDLNTVLNFLASFKLGTNIPSIELNAPLPDGKRPFAPLSTDEINFIRALGEALIVPGKHVPPFNDKSLSAALQAIEELPNHLISAYRLTLWGLHVYFLTRCRKSFHRLSLEKRREWCANLQESKQGDRAIFFASFPIKLAHFNRRDYLDSVGVPTYESNTNETSPRYMANVTTAQELEEENHFEADVIVVGTGAGGGPAAAILAEKGLAVAVIEAGEFLRRKDFSGSPIQRLKNTWRDGGMLFSLGNVPINIPQGSLVGGTTAINAGTCFRTPSPILQQWQDDFGFPADLTAEGMETYFKKVEQEIQVVDGEKHLVGPIGDLVHKGATKMGGTCGLLRRNAPDCDAQGTCTVGCPTDARRSTNVSYIPRALKANAQLFTGFTARRILRRGRSITGIEAFSTNPHAPTKKLTIKASATVIAAGSIFTPALLLSNGFKLPWLGKNLSIHPSIGMFVRCNEISNPWDAIPQGIGVTGIGDSRIHFEGGYVAPQLSSSVFPLTGERLTHWMDHQASVSIFGFMIKDESVGRVRLGPGDKPLVFYSLNNNALNLFKLGAANLAEMLLRGGGIEVIAGLGLIKEIKNIAEAKAILNHDLQASDFRIIGFHPLGTCRLGANSDLGVTDFEHRVFGTDNLYVMDGSNVPTSLGVNPQITIMSLATRAAEHLAERLT